MTGKQIVGFAIVGQAEPLRKLPGQVDTSNRHAGRALRQS